MAGGDDGGIKPFGPPVVGFFPGTSERHFPFSANLDDPFDGCAV